MDKGSEQNDAAIEPLTLLDDVPIDSYRHDALGLLPFAKAISSIVVGTDG